MRHFFSNTVLSALILSLGLITGSRYYYYSPFYQKFTKAVAVVHPTKGSEISGTVHFIQQQDGLHISAKISGLKQGKHGFHVHEFGDCACDDAVCAGDHFNPTNQPHGGPNAAKRHVGDFGNLVADENGNAHYELVDTKATLNGPNSLIGRSVIVHADEDDLVSQPTGNAGARLGCGVIGISK